MKHASTFVILIFALQGCMSSQVGGNGDQIETNNLIQEEIRGLHYEAHKNRLTYVFGLPSSFEAFEVLEANRSLLESQTLNAKSFAALVKIYAKACEEVSTSRINQSMGYQAIHAKITGVTLKENVAQQIQSNLLSLYQQEDNAEDLTVYAYCFQAATSKDALLLNVVVNPISEGGQ